MGKTPFIGFGNDTLEKQPRIEVGDVIVCPKCEEEHTIYGSDPDNLLQFYKCGETPYLAGVEGKSVFGVKPDVKGEI